MLDPNELQREWDHLNLELKYVQYDNELDKQDPILEEMKKIEKELAELTGKSLDAVKFKLDFEVKYRG